MGILKLTLLSSVLLTSFTCTAGLLDFKGTWKNTVADIDDILEVKVSINNDSTTYVEVWSECGEYNCYWGKTKAIRFFEENNGGRLNTTALKAIFEPQQSNTVQELILRLESRRPALKGILLQYSNEIQKYDNFLRNYRFLKK